MNATLTAGQAPLTAEDRCDRCGAQAYLRVSLASGGELLFCGHHGREHMGKLSDLAVKIHDESGRLGQTSATAAAEER